MKELVPRELVEEIAEQWDVYGKSCAAIAKELLAARAIIKVAVRMRDQGTMCEVTGFDGPTPDCRCESCEVTRAFDALRETARCGQCGQPFSARACGPTHAMVTAERKPRRESAAERDERIVREAGPWLHDCTMAGPQFCTPSVVTEGEWRHVQSERIARAAARILNRIAKRGRK